MSAMLFGCGDKSKVAMESVQIVGLPICTVYESGETPDLSGLKVVAVYSDGTRKTLGEEEYATDCPSR